MPRLKKVLLALLIISATLSLYAWSWTYTPHGRLDFGAALTIKLIEFADDGNNELTPERRAEINVMTAEWADQDFQAFAELRDINIPSAEGDIAARFYRPTNEDNLPLVLWLHGGGFWVGDYLPGYDAEISDLAHRANTAVLSIDYRLMPEHKFPKGIDDCYAALVWAAKHAAELNIDPSRIAVFGVSAGGNMAAAIAQRTRNERGPKLLAQLLLMPVTDLSGENDWPSSRLFAEGYILTMTPEAQKVFITNYFSNPADRMSPYASPILESNFKDLPSTLIVTAQYDPLRDQGEAYGKALSASGVPTKVIRYDRALHGLMGSGDSKKAAATEQVKALRSVFYQDGQYWD